MGERREHASGSADVVVVGGGAAGWIAASRAQQSGAQVTLVERSENTPGWGNSVLSGGAMHAVLDTPYRPPVEMAHDVMEVTDGWADSGLVRSWSEGIAGALKWVKTNGGNVVMDGQAPHRAAVLAPVKPTEPGLAYKGTGTDSFLLQVASGFSASGGQVYRPARAVGLERTDDHRWLVEVDAPSGSKFLTTRSVVLADGGFQADREMVEELAGLRDYHLRGADTSCGDALRMARSVGAALVDSRGFYGHLLARGATHDQRLWPYPVLDHLAASGIVVDETGRRFADEGISGVHTTNEVARSISPGNCWVVIDEPAWQGAGRAGQTAPNPYLTHHVGAVVRRNSLDELADAIGVGKNQLQATAADVVSDPRGAAVSRTGSVSLQEPPYYAIPVIPGISFMFGGLHVDGSARVLDESSEPIPGLYAAGGSVGGLHGGPRDGYAGGLLEAVVGGFIAGSAAGGPARV